MLPPGHIEFTWAALNLLQRQAGLFEDADYRWAALAAVLPDLIDKPLATFVLTDAEAALLYGHTALLHGGPCSGPCVAGASTGGSTSARPKPSCAPMPRSSATSHCC